MDDMKKTVQQFMESLVPQLEEVSLRGTTVKATFPLSDKVYYFEIQISTISKAEIEALQAELNALPEGESN
jgi:hypothetical protein